MPKVSRYYLINSNLNTQRECTECGADEAGGGQCVIFSTSSLNILCLNPGSGLGMLSSKWSGGGWGGASTSTRGVNIISRYFSQYAEKLPITTVTLKNLLRNL